MSIEVSHLSKLIEAKIHLPSSKSESNRALIINALTGNKCDIQNVSAARDTQTMKRLLASTDEVLDVIDAGTTMRFLTAFYGVQKGVNKTITGTERMCERPIGLLVEALKQIGSEITYLKTDGYPPLQIKGLQEQKADRISIRGDVSSQFISALLMVAPTLPKGLTLELTGEIGSRPYIMMTLQMMADFGIKYSFDGNIISVAPQPYKSTSFWVESDWSGASYWFSVAALAQRAELELVGLKRNSLQGDAAIVGIMEKLGVFTTFLNNSIVIKKDLTFRPEPRVEIDFTDCPDIAQTVAVICAAKGVELVMTGVESLKIKETDRLYAIKTELGKFGSSVEELGSQRYLLKNPADVFVIHKKTSIATYKDHRMAMAFAPLGLMGDIFIEEPDVVVKSYPSYWDDLKVAGFTIKG